jgi:hypothetical protein
MNLVAAIAVFHFMGLTLPEFGGAESALARQGFRVGTSDAQDFHEYVRRDRSALLGGVTIDVAAKDEKVIAIFIKCRQGRHCARPPPETQRCDALSSDEWTCSQARLKYRMFICAASLYMLTTSLEQFPAALCSKLDKRARAPAP